MTPLLPDLVWNALFGAVGLAAGFLIGRYERVAQAGKTRRQRWTDIARVAFGLLLIGLVVATGVSAANTNECYRDAFSQVIGSLNERSDATGQASAEQRRFLLAVRDRPGTTDAEIDSYLAALDRLEQARQSSPLPAVPECGR